MKIKFLARIVVLAFIASVFLGCFSSCSSGGSKQKLQEFYDLASESKALMDEIADTIYSNWYDAIYNSKYNGSIDLAVAMAQYSNEDNINRVNEIDPLISNLFKELRDGSSGAQVKSVMSAYSDYYEFVVNVSGSFTSYSKNKEELKKALASALKTLSFEL